jgi:tRNA-splicing ligase RtcB
MRIDLDRSIFQDKLLAQEILRGISNSVPVLKRTRHHHEFAMPAELATNELSMSTLEKEKVRDGLRQLGTIGRGNHFIELQSDSGGSIWLMVHTGSRGMGQAIFGQHTREAKRADSGLLYLDAATEAGQAFLNDIRWATNYAAVNRVASANACELIIRNITGHGADPLSTVNVPHNFLRTEEHFGEHLLVHRKSALSAAQDEIGLIPGSMAGPSFHVLGRGSYESLESCAHGAGRTMSRSEARHEISPAEFRRQMGKVVFNSSAENALVDEAPGAYKNPREVMRAQRDLVKTIRELTPILNYKVP